MSRLLVIEPNLMLRYALAVALTPDHLAQFTDALPDDSALKNVDGLVVDVAMLRQCNKPIDMAVVESWRMPTLCLDDEESAAPVERVNWVTLKMPVQRERLLKAVFDCLNPAAGSSTAPAKKAQSSTALGAKNRAKKTGAGESMTSAPAANVIELVEVVEEDPENR